MPLSPKARIWLRRAAVVCAVALALLVALWLTLQTRWGRAKAGELIESAVSNAIAGKMRIDEVLSIGFTSAHVRGLAFEDPRGRDVIHIDDAEVHLAWSALLAGTLRFDRARARGAEVVIATGQTYSTSIEDAFSAREPSDDDDGLKVVLDHVAIEDTAVRLLAGITAAVHVSRASLGLDHDPSRAAPGERPTEVILSDVYGNFYMDGREAISGTDVRARGSIFDLRLRVCHPRGVVALRVILGRTPPRLVYSADRPLLNIALRMVDRFSAVQLDSGNVDLTDVPRCGPPPGR